MIRIKNLEYKKRNAVVIDEINNILSTCQRRLIVETKAQLKGAYYRVKKKSKKYHKEIYRINRNFLFDCTPTGVSLKPYMSIDIYESANKIGAISKTNKSVEHPNGRTKLISELFELQDIGKIDFLNDDYGVVEYYKFLQRRVFTIYLTSKQNKNLAKFIDKYKCSVIEAYEALGIELVKINWKYLGGRGNPKIPINSKKITIKEMLEEMDNIEKYKYDWEMKDGEKATKESVERCS